MAAKSVQSRPFSIEHLFIVNAAGGLIYNLVWGSASPLTGNDSLRMASTFHSLHAIAQQISPTGKGGGILELETSSFSLKCYQTPTGIKIFCTCTPGTPNVPQYLRQIHELYADWVLKDPFYELDMPIRVEKFEQKLLQFTTDRFGPRAMT
jgi:trafficking protein particle complex subunit 4